MELDYNHLKDIPWNFLIGNDGNVYEGRGFNFEGEHTQNQHSMILEFVLLLWEILKHLK